MEIIQEGGSRDRRGSGRVLTIVINCLIIHSRPEGAFSRILSPVALRNSCDCGVSTVYNRTRANGKPAAAFWLSTLSASKSFFMFTTPAEFPWRSSACRSFGDYTRSPWPILMSSICFNPPTSAGILSRWPNVARKSWEFCPLLNFYEIKGSRNSFAYNLPENAESFGILKASPWNWAIFPGNVFMACIEPRKLSRGSCVILTGYLREVRYKYNKLPELFFKIQTSYPEIEHSISFLSSAKIR